MKRSKKPRPTRARVHEPFEIGRTIKDTRNDQVGVVLDCACQYAHPKAAPVYSYLVRWDDGQVHALSESAFSGGHGFLPAD